MSKVAIDCPICLNYKTTITKFNICRHCICNDCAFQMLIKCMDRCPICRQRIELAIIPDTKIVLDENYKEEKKSLYDLLNEETAVVYDSEDSDNEDCDARDTSWG